MRITSGKARGRILKVPKSIRPTQDRVREAYFSKMGDMVAGCRFLDLFAGSGAVGLEAWSRGAGECLLVDLSRSVLKVATANVSSICGTADGMDSGNRVRAVCSDANKFVERPAGSAYGLIFADPPYAAADVSGFSGSLLRAVAENQWLDSDGVMTIERRSGRDAEQCDGWNLMDSRKYGESALDFYVLAEVQE